MTYRKPPFLLRKWQRLQMRYYAYRNPEKLVRIRYRQRFGTDPDLENPRTFNEKVLWMMLHADTTRWSQLADKYRVREYVEQCGLGWMLNELYGVWESAEEIDFSGGGKLPDTFVLKTNNGYGQVIIVNDRQKADIRSIRRTLNHTLRKKFGRMTAEHHYFGIKPRIIAERLLPSEPAFGNSLIDYKFYCFDGNPYCCMVCYNRKSPSDVKTGLYDARTWKNIGHYVTGKYYDPHQCDIPRPASLDRMLDAAKRLSSGFPQVRVDLYEVAGNPVFGELTFTSSAGMDTGFSQEFQELMGSQISLPPAKRTQPSHPGLLGLLGLRKAAAK